MTPLWRRGLAPGRYFDSWLRKRIAESPLARSLGRHELTFADVERHDLPAGLEPGQRERARFRLRVIAADVSGGRRSCFRTASPASPTVRAPPYGSPR